MQILGHKFLRSNFMTGSPLRLTAAAKQINRLANIPKYIQGIGCRIVKSTVGDGKDWFVIVDGTSDVKLPPGWVWPWDEGSDQFTIQSTGDATIQVRAGTWTHTTRAGDYSVTTTGEAAIGQVVSSGGAGTIQWVSTANYNDWSSDYTITESSKLWLRYDRTSTILGTLTCVVLASATIPTPAARVDWRQIGEVTFADGAITKVAQYADDSPNAVAVPASSFAMTKSGTLTASGAVTFDSVEYKTNTNWLAPHAGLAKVDIAQTGVYHFSIGAAIGVCPIDSFTIESVNVALRINGTATYCAIDASLGWIESRTGLKRHDHGGATGLAMSHLHTIPQEPYDVVSSMAMSHRGGCSSDFLLTAGQYVDLYVTVAGASGTHAASYFRLSGHLIHPT